MASPTLNKNIRYNSIVKQRYETPAGHSNIPSSFGMAIAVGGGMGRPVGVLVLQHGLHRLRRFIRPLRGAFSLSPTILGDAAPYSECVSVRGVLHFGR